MVPTGATGMFAKFTVIILTAVLAAAALLALRQRRFEVGHQMVETTRKIDQARREIWDVQTRLAARVDPRALQQAIAQAQVKLEPLVPLDTVKPAATAPIVVASAHRSSHRGN
jgi:hypothetical protein